MTSQQKRSNVKGLDAYVETFAPKEQPSLRKYKQLKRSAGVALEVNRRNPFHASEESTIILNPWQTPSEVENMGISGPTKGLMSSNFFWKKISKTVKLPTCLRKAARVSPQPGSPRDTGWNPGSCRPSLYTDRRSHPHHPGAKSQKCWVSRYCSSTSIAYVLLGRL